MKKWLKKHSKYLITSFAILFIANTSYGIYTATEGWVITLDAFCIAFWLLILLEISGITKRIFNWWSRE